MIHLCTCSGGSASALAQTRKQEATDSCKNCGGKPLVDGRGALSGSMLSTVGIELNRVIDPDLNWRTVSKSNKRGARRARASLTAGNKKKHVAGSLKGSEDLIDKDLKGVEDMPVSESEKLGVTVLGRRFSNSVENIPLKKRKFMFRSPSPPPRTQSPCPLEFEHLHKSQSASNRMVTVLTSNVEQQANRFSRGYKRGLDAMDSAVEIDDENKCLEEMKPGDNADFSGISILAAAACNSNIELGVSNADEGSNRILLKIESSSMPEELCQKHLPDNAGILDCKTNVSAEIFAGRTISLIANNGQKIPELSHGLNETAAVMGSFLAEKSPDSSQNLEIKENGTLGRPPSSSQDDRSHWDLNTVMDAWEAPYGNLVVEAEPHHISGIREDSTHEGKAAVIDHCEIQMELPDTEHATEMTVQHEVVGTALNIVQEDVSGCGNSKLQEKPDFACDGSAAVIVPGKNGEAYPLVHEIHEETGEEQLLDASVASNRITCSQEKMLSCESNNVPSKMLDVAEDSKHNEEQIRANGENVISAPVEPLQELEGDCASLNAHSVVKGTADLHSISFGSATKGETASSHLFAGGDDSSDHDVHACESHSGAAHITSNAASEDIETNVAVDVGNHSEDQCTSAAQGCDVIHPSPLIGKDSCQIDGGSAISVSASSMSAMPVDKNAFNMITTHSIGSQVVPVDPFGDATCSAMDQSKNEVDSCHSDCHILESVDCEEQPAANACVSQDVLVAETMAHDGRVSLVADNRKDATESDLHSAHTLASETQGTVETQLDTGDLLSLEAHRSNEGDHARISGKVALEDSFDGDYDSDGSQNDHDNAIAMETVSELQGDDDSQYEDGEFRESFVHSWEDAGDEGDAEHVDYGSDNVDTDAFEMAADYTPSASLHVQNAECKKENSPEPDHVSQGGDLVVDKKEQETNHVPLRPPSKLFVCMESGKKRTLKVLRKASRGELMKKGGDKVLEMNVEVAANPAAEKAGVDDESGIKGDGARESSHSMLSRIKSTGWDQLPEVCRSTREAATDVGDQSMARSPGARFDSSDAGESLRRTGSTSNRELSSRIGGLKASDVSFRKDKTYVQGSRPHDLDDSNPRGERDGGPIRSVGRGLSSGHMRGRGRGSENWLDSSGGHWSRNRHHSPGGHYSGSDISPPGPRNAAAAAAAKLESSGYVLDANGTIVKSGAVVPVGRVHRRPANASSQGTHRSLMGRCSPTDRDSALRFGLPVGHGPIRELSPGRSISAGRGRSGRNGSRVFATGRRERYSGPIPDDDIDSSFHMQHTLARRERSFSPIPRRTFHISRSRTKSRSRSRTRSPHMWTSPRGRSGGINGGTGFRRHSRSPPNFRSEARMERLRSPDRRPRYAAHMVDFVSASRSHGSPPHASRWADDRKDAPDYYREHDYKRSSGSERSPPGRAFPRGHRFDFMGSPGRLKPEEYRPVHSGRLPEFVGVGRGTRHDGSDDDRRKHGERYGMIHSIRHYDIDGDVKRFRYDVEDGFRPHNSRTKNAPEFHGRGGSPPRDYGRDIDGRLGAAPRRVREERGHFRCDRDGKQNASFKAFGMRECDEDGTLRRRRPS